MGSQNFRIGAVKAWFKGRYLGHTLGGATIAYEPDIVDMMADQFGTSPVDKAVKGEKVTVTLPLAEDTIENWADAIPAGTVAGGTDGRLEVGSNAGKRLGESAGELILHPLAFADDDASYDIVLHKAVSGDSVEIGKNNEDQMVIEIKFSALVDETQEDGNWLFHVGDSTD